MMEPANTQRANSTLIPNCCVATNTAADRERRQPATPDIWT